MGVLFSALRCSVGFGDCYYHDHSLPVVVCLSTRLEKMFSKGKSGYRLLESNPILSHYEVGRLYASGGPEGVWKIYEGVSKVDGKVGHIHTIKAEMKQAFTYFGY